MTNDTTNCILATSTNAWISAFIIDTRLLETTFTIGDTFGAAIRRFSNKTAQTSTR